MSLTAEGFERQRLSDIKADYDQRITNALGPVNTSSDSVIGQIEGIWAEALDNIYEALQDIYDSMYPNTAEGSSLDGTVAYVGLERLQATTTIVTAAAYGSEGTLIPTGALAHADIQYSATSDVVISRANALDVNIQIDTVANSTVYNILAGGVSVVYTSSAAATKTEIANGLSSLLNSGQFTSTASGEQFRIYSTDGVTPFSISVDPKISINSRASPVIFVASKEGKIACPIGALSVIDTPIFGWDSIYNLTEGDIGRDVETDVELRLRHASAKRATGSATVESIKSRMLSEVDSVTSVKIYENRTLVTSSDGIPGKAFESVIVGGTNQDIADQLWKTKPAGIETHGNISVNVTDSTGDVQVVKFSRPTVKYGWLNIGVILNPEEPLSESAALLIKQSCVDYANENISAGDDVIIQRFYGPIYKNVTGIGQLTITAAITNSITDIPSYSSSNISIGKSENAIFAIDRITVAGV